MQACVCSANLTARHWSPQSILLVVAGGMLPPEASSGAFWRMSTQPPDSAFNSRQPSPTSGYEHAETSITRNVSAAAEAAEAEADVDNAAGSQHVPSVLNRHRLPQPADVPVPAADLQGARTADQAPAQQQELSAGPSQSLPSRRVSPRRLARSHPPPLSTARQAQQATVTAPAANLQTHVQHALSVGAAPSLAPLLAQIHRQVRPRPAAASAAFRQAQARAATRAAISNSRQQSPLPRDASPTAAAPRSQRANGSQLGAIVQDGSDSEAGDEEVQESSMFKQCFKGHCNNTGLGKVCTCKLPGAGEYNSSAFVQLMPLCC